jgi:YD repeat-containing protein
LLLSVSLSGESSESYSYDGDKELSGITRTIGSKTYTTSYQRTSAGQLTQLSYASGRAIHINHDATGRLSAIVNNGDSTNYVSGLSYNYAGQVTGWTLGGTNGGGIVEALGYDSNRLQMTSQTVTQNGATRLSLTYSYAASAGQNDTGMAYSSNLGSSKFLCSSERSTEYDFLFIRI